MLPTFAAPGCGTSLTGADALARAQLGHAQLGKQACGRQSRGAVHVWARLQYGSPCGQPPSTEIAHMQHCGMRAASRHSPFMPPMGHRYLQSIEIAGVGHSAD